MAKPKGYVIYDGPSRLDGKPIIAILTLASANIKTGNMAQLWIMARDEMPHVAKKNGNDSSVCGNCPIKEGCYLDLSKAPLAVWKGFHRGIYSTPNNHEIMILKDYYIRFGAYGDGAALPVSILNSLASLAKDFTGYTHQWKRFKSMNKFFMASVESEKLAIQAQGKGFRTFRVRKPGTELLPGEIECLSSAGVQCIDCRLCNGSKQARNISIEAHGARKGAIAYV